MWLLGFTCRGRITTWLLGFTCRGRITTWLLGFVNFLRQDNHMVIRLHLLRQNSMAEHAELMFLHFLFFFFFLFCFCFCCCNYGQRHDSERGMKQTVWKKLYIHVAAVIIHFPLMNFGLLFSFSTTTIYLLICGKLHNL